ncbi:PLC-like phosphodiesterases superfamily protein [Striga hermonthica]|uniref:PLC-like phosphodiesterases superfamily protein n=1 Tax=Striga hermonthica TaxID=68872 RepID=A0A9N7NDD2_STRHE|nr:PLC-like phosphodiesterases superfamily protein [Striga hermonthica]
MRIGKVLSSVIAVLLVSKLLEAACSNGDCKNNSLPFNKYAFLTTHNSFAIDDGKLRLTFTNQEDTISQQLNNGVRGLMLDVYDYKGDIWLCHSLKGKCHDTTKFEPAIETFREIEAFLSQNPYEIVTLILEDYVETPNGLTNVFNESGIMKYWFPLSSMPKGGQDWPLAIYNICLKVSLLLSAFKDFDN